MALTMTDIDQFIADLLESVSLVKGTPKECDRFVANLKFAISYAKKKAEDRPAERIHDIGSI